MKTDYPKLKYQVVPMPTGPSGKQGTLSFTNCWGVAAKSKNQAAAVSLINYLTTAKQQLSFAETVGVMPSRESAKAQFVAQNPAQQAFIDEAGYAVPQVTTPGFPQVQAQLKIAALEFNRKYPGINQRLIQDGRHKAIFETTQPLHCLTL